MPLDHYVSQVHLRNFCSPELGGHLLYAIRKSDLVKFQTRPQDVCRIQDNSTNEFLKDTRIIEEFLKEVEPRYNASLIKVRADQIDRDCILSIAGFTAYVMTCSPTAMRTHVMPLKRIVESTAMVADANGEFDTMPSALGDKTLTELLADGTIKIEVDPKYPQAIGISSIIDFVSIFGNSYWEILLNGEPGSPFFTSDYPVGTEVIDSNVAVNRVVPLAPDLAIRIIPDVSLSRATPDLEFTRFKYRTRTLSRQEVLYTNRLIVRSAEDHVFYRDERNWITPFVEKNRRYHVQLLSDRIPSGTGFLHVSRQRLVEGSV